MGFRRPIEHAGRQAVVVAHPLRAGLPVFGLASLALVLWAVGVEGTLIAATLAGAIGGAGTMRLLLARRKLLRLRQEADIQLSTYHFPPDAALAAWRRGELTGRRKRKLLARSLERITRDASEKWLPGASPLNRVAARRYEHLFPILAERLRSDGGVSVAGVLMVEDLLRNPESPLYAREREHELGLALTRCLGALANDGGSINPATTSDPASSMHRVADRAGGPNSTRLKRALRRPRVNPRRRAVGRWRSRSTRSS